MSLLDYSKALADFWSAQGRALSQAQNSGGGYERLRDFDAVLCLECGRPGNGVVTARKGGQWAAIRLAGVAAQHCRSAPV